MNSVLIRYHEIALKKGNRAYFTELLKRNILSAVKDLGAKEIRSLPARLLLAFLPQRFDDVLHLRVVYPKLAVANPFDTLTQLFERSGSTKDTIGSVTEYFDDQLAFVLVQQHDHV